jgi:hypothetical protein
MLNLFYDTVLMEHRLKVKTHLKVGEQVNTLPVGQASQYTQYAQSVLNGLVGSLKSEISNLKVWSLIRMKGDGFSDWVIVNQRPKA